MLRSDVSALKFLTSLEELQQPYGIDVEPLVRLSFCLKLVTAIGHSEEIGPPDNSSLQVLTVT